MTTAYCPNCGGSLTHDSTACSQCGTPVLLAPVVPIPAAVVLKEGEVPTAPPPGPVVSEDDSPASLHFVKDDSRHRTDHLLRSMPSKGLGRWAKMSAVGVGIVGCIKWGMENYDDIPDLLNIFLNPFALPIALCLIVLCIQMRLWWKKGRKHSYLDDYNRNREKTDSQVDP